MESNVSMRYEAFPDYVQVFLDRADNSIPIADIDQDRIVNFASYTAVPLERRREIRSYAQCMNPRTETGAPVFREKAKPVAGVIPGASSFWKARRSKPGVVKIATAALMGAGLHDDAKALQSDPRLVGAEGAEILLVLQDYVRCTEISNNLEPDPALRPEVTAAAVVSKEIVADDYEIHRLLRKVMEPEYRESLEQLANLTPETMAYAPEEAVQNILLYQLLREEIIDDAELLLRFEHPLHALSETVRALDEGPLCSEYVSAALRQMPAEDQDGRSPDRDLEVERSRCVRTLAGRLPEELDDLVQEDPAPLLELMAHRVLSDHPLASRLAGMERPMEAFLDAYCDIAGDYVPRSSVETVLHLIELGDPIATSYETIAEYEETPQWSQTM